MYHEHNGETYNANDLQAEIDKLSLDDDVQSVSGIVPYVLSKHIVLDQKYLYLRVFSDGQKLRKYKEQKGICPICKQQFELSEMDVDHIKPWSKGGHTTYDNLQMLCKHDNEVKSNKLING